MDSRTLPSTVIETWALDWIHAHRDQAIWLVPLLAFAEACLGIGLFVSGLFLVIVCSFLHAEQLASLPWISTLAFLGATAGDHTGFLIGHRLGPRVHEMAWVQRHRSKLDRAEAMIRARGAWAIVIGRFVPAIRSLIPAALGIGGFNRLRYSLVDLLACALWACALALIVAGIGQI